jgi:hypothetical protein
MGLSKISIKLTWKKRLLIWIGRTRGTSDLSVIDRVTGSLRVALVSRVAQLEKYSRFHIPAHTLQFATGSVLGFLDTNFPHGKTVCVFLSPKLLMV